jgi:hypothetical protein
MTTGQERPAAISAQRRVRLAQAQQLPRRRLAPLALLFAMVLVAAGCGSGKSATTATTNASSSTGETQPGSGAQSSASDTSTGSNHASASGGDFAARAQAICKQLKSALAAPKPLGLGQAQVISIVSKRVAAEEATLAQLRQLEPPAALGPDWSKIIAGRQALIYDTHQFLQAAQQGNKQGMSQAAAATERDERKMAAVAARHGLIACEHVE